MTTKQRVVTRSRPSLSCLPCKRRKVKCEKQHPTCGNCVRLKDDCWYEPFHAPRAATETSLSEKKRRRLETSPPESAAQLSIEQLQSQQCLRSNDHQEDRHTPQWNPLQPSFPSRAVQSNLRVPTTSRGEHDQSQVQHHNSINHSFAALLEHNAANGDLYEVSGFTRNPNSYHQTEVGTSTIRDIMQHSTAAIAASYPSQQSQKEDSVASTSSWPNFVATKIGASAPTFTFGTSSPSLEPRATFQDCSRRPSSLTLSHIQEASKPSGYVNRQLSGHAKYVGNTFWALAGNHTEICNDVLQTQYEYQKTLQSNQHRSSVLTRIAKELPPKSLCDVFLKAFLLGVAPVTSLVHVPSLVLKYNSFWSRHGATLDFDGIEDFPDDVSFLPMLWAILYCGAISAPSSFLVNDQVDILDKSVLIKLLLDKFNATLALCKFNTLPTLNSLIALLLTECCSQGEEDVITEGAFTSHTMQIAKTLGLHQENTYSGLDEVERETARRVWWHILYLEVRATIASGSHLLHKNGEAAHSVRMVSELRDQDIRTGVIGDCNLTADAGPEPRHASTAMLLSIARYEHSRTLRQIVERCYEAVPTKVDFEYLEKEIQTYHTKVDGIISRLKVRGMPENGHVSSHLLGANPVTQPSLYEDHPGKETVFNAWTRICLSMLQLYPWIIFYRQFLGQVDGNYDKIRNSERNLCCSFLQHFLQLARLPAFSPYYWFCPGKMQPLQECMIILICLQNQPSGIDTELPRYLLDEVFAVFSVGNESTDHSSLFSFKPSQRYKASWQVVARMRDQVFRNRETRTHMTRRPSHMHDQLSQINLFENRRQSSAESIPRCPLLSNQTPTEADSPCVVTPRISTTSSRFNNFDDDINNILGCTPQAAQNHHLFDDFNPDFMFKHGGETSGFYDNKTDDTLNTNYGQDMSTESWLGVAHIKARY